MTSHAAHPALAAWRALQARGGTRGALVTLIRADGSASSARRTSGASDASISSAATVSSRATRPYRTTACRTSPSDGRGAVSAWTTASANGGVSRRVSTGAWLLLAASRSVRSMRCSGSGSRRSWGNRWQQAAGRTHPGRAGGAPSARRPAGDAAPG